MAKIDFHRSLFCVALASGTLAGCEGSTPAQDLGTNVQVDAGDAGPDTSPDAGPSDLGTPDAGAIDAGPAPLSPSWRAYGQAPPSTPPERWGGKMVSIPGENRLILFGGSRYPEGEVVSDTWSFSLIDETWTELQTTNPPPPRYCHCQVYLPEQGQLLVVGGRGGQGPLPPAAWTLDLESLVWETIPAPVPNEIVGCHSAWMPGVGAIIFGGDGTRGMANKTWRYDPDVRTFTELNPSSPPPARRDGAFAYNPNVSGGQILLYGGATAVFPSGMQLTDLWAFDGVEWTELTQDMSGPLPPPRRWSVDGLMPARNLLVMFGGTTEAMDYDDLWTLDLETLTWTEHTLAGAPSRRGGAASAMVPQRDALLFFGGLGQPDFRAFADGWALDLSAM